MNETLTTTLGYNAIYDSNGTYSVNFDLTSLLSQKQKEELIIKLLESEDEFMPILKKYLVGYLDKILDDPEEIIKEVVAEKDEKIQRLENKVSELEKELRGIKNLLPVGINPTIPGNSPWRTIPDITWNIGDVTSNTCSTSTYSSTV